LKGVFRVTKEEQETVITWDKSSCMMRVYTADPVLIRRLKGLQSYKLITEHRQGGEVIACDFEAEKKLLTLRSKPTARTMTEEQKEAARERMREYNRAK